MFPLRWLAALLALAAVAFAQPLQLDPAGRIAFIDPSGRLATVHPDGSGLELLTEVGRRFQFPAWSPDGDKIAAIGIEQGIGTVEVFSLAGEEPLELYRSLPQPPFYLYWSPDSQTVSFLANHPTNVIGLHLVSLSEGSDRVLLTGSPFYWNWAADSDSMLVHIGPPGSGSRLGFTEAGDDTLVENLDTPGFFQAPVISASGHYVAFANVGSGGARSVILRSRSGGAGEPVERELRHQGLTALAFSPTEDLLALMRPPQAAPFSFGPIQILDAESGRLEPLVDDVAFAFFWSPDGRFIAYLTPFDSSGQQASLGDSQLVSLQPARRFSLKVAEVASGDIRELAVVIPSPMFLRQFLPFFDQYALSHRLWSPDSDALVIPLLDSQGRSQITIISLDGSQQVVAEGDTPFWNVR